MYVFETLNKTSKLNNKNQNNNYEHYHIRASKAALIKITSPAA